MVNEIILVGKLNEKSSNIEKENKLKHYSIKLDVVRSIKNSEGFYEHDLINITLWRSIYETLSDICEIGDLISVKGRIQIKNEQIEIIAEKISYLNKYLNI